MVSLDTLLDLVGKLDDAVTDDPPRERLRTYLLKNVTQVGAMRDYVEECLRESGDQHSRALQDLVNHLGRLIGFTVVFGRYKGVQGQVGYDGIWTSPLGKHIVIEVKTTDAYSVKTSTLVGYVDQLISQGKIPDWGSALGLYVVARADNALKSLENSIIAEKRTNQLRVITVDRLTALAEIYSSFESMTHERLLSILLPGGPVVDPLVELMTGLVAQQSHEAQLAPPPASVDTLQPVNPPSGVQYFMTSVASDDEETAVECICRLLSQKFYAFSAKSAYRNQMKAGDWLCFYAAGTGVVAHARLATAPAYQLRQEISNPEDFPWVIGLDSVTLYVDKPVVLDAVTRGQMDIFAGKDPGKPWAWVVQGTRKLTDHDFDLLTRR